MILKKSRGLAKFSVFTELLFWRADSRNNWKLPSLGTFVFEGLYEWFVLRDYDAFTRIFSWRKWLENSKFHKKVHLMKGNSI